MNTKQRMASHVTPNFASFPRITEWRLDWWQNKNKGLLGKIERTCLYEMLVTALFNNMPILKSCNDHFHNFCYLKPRLQGQLEINRGKKTRELLNCRVWRTNIGWRYTIQAPNTTPWNSTRRLPPYTSRGKSLGSRHSPLARPCWCKIDVTIAGWRS